MQLPVAVSILIAIMAPTTKAMEASKTRMYEVAMPLKMEAYSKAPAANFMRDRLDYYKEITAGGVKPCEDGLVAGEFPCKKMDLTAYLTGEDLGSPYASLTDPLIYATWVSDIWGWVDPNTGKEYGLIGMWDGVSIVDITDPVYPEVVCFVETTGGVIGGLDGFNNIWRDIKVVNDVMYIGAEVSFHGIQAVDLTKLETFPRSTEGVPIVSPDYTTPELGSTHNIVGAPEAGKMMGVGMAVNDKTCPGINVGTDDEMVASLALFDVSENPVEPVFEKCVYVDNTRGYVHDAHCIKYDGPTMAYKGVNICALFMEEAIVIYNLDAFEIINEFSYDTFAFVHQGWFSEDHTTLYADDEIDELEGTTGTEFSTCYIFDVTDLDGEIAQPIPFVTPSAHPSIDHNLYIKDGYIYQAAYTSGARVRKIMPDMSIEEIAFFDGESTCECLNAPDCSCDVFAGTWTYFPYYDSGITIAGGTAEGLFILKPDLTMDLSIAAFYLVDTADQVDIALIEDGDVFQWSEIGRRLSVRVEVGDDVDSVVFGLDGGEYSTENIAPYLLGGDVPGRTKWFAVPELQEEGTYTVSATAYFGPDGTGSAGPSSSVTFGVTRIV